MLGQEMEKNNSTINTFEEINWKDPFPPLPKKRKSIVGGRRSTTPSRKKKKKLAEKKLEDPIYEEMTFNPLYPPALTFIPHKEIMIKMMKVCVET